MRTDLGRAIRSASTSAHRRDRGGDRGAGAGRLAVTSRIRHRHVPTLADAMRERLAAEGRGWSRPWQAAVDRYASRFEELLGDVPLDQLTIAHVERLRRSWPEGATSWNRARSAIISTWRAAQRREVVALDRRCPAEAVPAYRERPSCWAAPDAHHLELDRAVVVAVERNVVSVSAGRAIRLLAYTARRPSEIVSAPACAVRGDLAVLHLATTKIGEVQLVPLHGVALEVALAAQRDATLRGSVWLFPGQKDPRKHCHLGTLAAAWRRVLDVADALGVETRRSDGRRFSVRDFRPLGITAMARAGVQPNIIARVVGHRSTATTERYMRLSDADARRGQLALFGSNVKIGSEEELKRNVAANVAALRKARGWTAIHCADKVGITRQYWYQLEESGKTNTWLLLKVGELFGVTLEQLLAKGEA